jgi:formylglycine-generating enzyme
MVAVAGRVCVDRYEATLVNASSFEPLSPYYPPTSKLAVQFFGMWEQSRKDSPRFTVAGFMPLPELPVFQHSDFIPRAIAWPESVPNAYVSGELAEKACKNAGKRLCSQEEWVTACRGQRQTKYPYGNNYSHGACNVFREEHPAHLLHDDFSAGHSDPRLNQIWFEGEPLLRKTGETESCVSTWGNDVIYDMVGNLDEWVDDPKGAFLGGFYARSTRNGCDARVDVHPYRFFDYSTGVRCCRSPLP